MNNNISSTGLAYTDMTYEDIMHKVNERFKSDKKFKNFQESDVGKMMIEMFAGMTDMLNYNIERTAQESFFSTLTRYRSAVKHANDMSYDIQRASPAVTDISIRVDPTSLMKTAELSNNEDDNFIKHKILVLPKNTMLSFQGSKFILTEELNYVFTLNEMRTLQQGGHIIINTTGIGTKEHIISVLQAESKMVELKGVDFKDNFDSNGEGNIFQRYTIEDKTFSNFYGEHDPYNTSTTVAIGETFESAHATNKFVIHRQSLITGKEIESRSLTKAQYYKNTNKSRTMDTSDKLYYENIAADEVFNKNVWIKTSAEVNDSQGIELKFGDGITLSKGLNNSKESLFITYLSTEGAKGNKYGVIGEQLNFISLSDDPWTQYLKLTPTLTSNILGGGDIESIESIKNRAPGMFQTFNRLVTKKDYLSFLRTLTSPIDVKNAIAWGEQDELEGVTFHNGKDLSEIGYASIRKLFNIVLYTVIGSLYEEVDGVYRPRTNMYNATLDSYSSNVIYPSQNYVSVLAQKNIVKQLKLDNKLLDGSIPIENFKFEISAEPLIGSHESSFEIFMKTVGLKKNISNDLQNILQQDTVTIQNVTVPVEMTLNLSNPTSTGVTPIELKINTVLGKNLNLLETVNMNDPVIIKKSTSGVDLSMPNSLPLTIKINTLTNLITTSNTQLLKGSVDRPDDALDLFSYNYTTKKVAALVAVNAYANLHITLKKITMPMYDDFFTTILNRDAHGFNTKNKNYLLPNMVTDFYLNLARQTTSKLVKPKNIFGNQEPHTYSYANIDNDTINHGLSFINNVDYSYTPWGSLIQELNNSFNKELQNKLSTIINGKTDTEINRFNFFDLIVNIEQDDEQISNTYIDRMLYQELTTKFRTELLMLDTIENIQAEQITPEYIHDKTNTKLAFIDSDFALINPIYNRTKEYIKKKVYSVIVPEYTNAVTRAIDIVDSSTFSNLLETYNISFTLDNDILITSSDNVKAYFESVAFIIDSNANTTNKKEITLTDSNNLVINKLIQTTTGNSIEYVLLQLEKGQLVKKYIDNTNGNVPALSSTLGVNNAIYEGTKHIATHLTPTIANRFKINISQKYQNNIYVSALQVEGDIVKPHIIPLHLFSDADFGNISNFNELILDMQIPYNNVSNIYDFIVKKAKVYTVAITEKENDITKNTYTKIVPHKQFTLDNGDFNEVLCANLYANQAGLTYEFNATSSTMNVTLTKESVDIILYCIGTVTEKYYDKVVNIFNYRSGINYNKALHVTGSYNNMPTLFNENKGVSLLGTNFTDIDFKLVPNYDYLQYDKLNDLESLKTFLSTENDENYKTKMDVHEVVLDALRPIADTITWKMLHGHTRHGFSSFKPFGPNEDISSYTNYATTSSSLLPTWFGFEKVIFNAYYNTNDVNVPENKYTDKISICNSRMKDKNLTTIKTVYVSPIIHNFQLSGTINIKDLADVTTAKAKIYSKLYKFLDEENDFSKTLYRSNLIEIIESFPDVINANVKLEPYNTRKKPTASDYYFDIDSFMDNTTSHYIFSAVVSKDRNRFQKIVIDAITAYVTKYKLTTTIIGSGHTVPVNNELDRIKELSLYNNLLSYNSLDITGKNLFEYEHKSLSKNVTERTFLGEVCKQIVENCEEHEIMSVNGYLLTRHKLFFMLLANIHNDFLPIIEHNMLNSQGDIDNEYSTDALYKDGEYHREKLRGGYSLSNEIIKVHVNCSVTYKEN